MSARDTIFALSSGRPPAAVAIIRISGPDAHAAAERLAGELPEPRTASVRQLRDPSTGELLDEALVLRFDAPATATGEDVVEFQCHGGRAVVAVVQAALATVAGLREAQPGEFTRRAFENGRIDLTEAEGLADLLEAETESQRKAALASAGGGLRKQIERWRTTLLDLSAQAERAIDYDEQDEGSDSVLSRDCAAFAGDLQTWLDRPRVEPLKGGVRVVVAGPPNAGKSSLINALVGEERAIVTDVPGTTRDHIDVPLALDGIPLLLTDTAGLRETEDVVETIGVRRAYALVETADVLVWLGEPAEAPAHPRLIRIHGQCDRTGRGVPSSNTIAVSAVTGEGIPALLASMARFAREVLPEEGAVALNRRQAHLIEEAAGAARLAAVATDAVIAAEELRRARAAFDQLTGRAGVEQVLDALFGRFCLGK